MIIREKEQRRRQIKKKYFLSLFTLCQFAILLFSFFSYKGFRNITHNCKNRKIIEKNKRVEAERSEY